MQVTEKIENNDKKCPLQWASCLLQHQASLPEDKLSLPNAPNSSHCLD
jgi:hypothetical protein